MDATVEIRRLVKVYHDDTRGEIRAVDGIDLEVRRGEVMGLLGVNGAGKTTTLRILATILSPTSGTALVMGHDVTAEPEEARRSLGYYSSTTALYPRLTARETLEFFARINGYPPGLVRRRVDELIEGMGMSRFAGSRVEKLSQGMKQKVSIARTIVHEPGVLIFDEPTAWLDVLNAHDMLEMIRDLGRSGHTVVFSTHIMSEAQKICDRIAIIHSGRIKAVGTPESLMSSTGTPSLEEAFVRLVRGGEV
ncbi:ABC transporter ATP-binding protein [Candidatus Fermentibacteria bacterium]|nr:ABC transporter ATP-binding protein [Candidatus Fermentibacteria bacterium]